MYNKSHIFKTKFTNFDMSLYPRNHHHNPVSDYEYICHPQNFLLLLHGALIFLSSIPIHQPHPQAISDPASVTKG